MKIFDNNKSFLGHFIAWLIFIVYEISVAITLGSDNNLWAYLPYYVIHILLFYTYAAILDQLSDNYKKNAMWLSAIVPLFFIYMVVILFVKWLLHQVHMVDSSFVLDRATVIGHGYRGIYFMLLSSGYWLAINKIKKDRRITELTIKNIEAGRDNYQIQNAYLMAQINEHLLFNTLNFVYNSVKKTSPSAAKSVEILADIMRHAISGPDADGMIRLTEEIDHIERLCKISRLRFDNGVYINLTIDNEYENIKIPPLILATFVENVFKHGDLTMEESPATIYLKTGLNSIYLKTENIKKSTGLKYAKSIGLKNTELRLKAFCGENNYSIELSEWNNVFTAILKVNLP